MTETSLSFSTNAKLEKLIGRELITNNIIAIFELIKNSYDAQAQKSYVEFVNFNINTDYIEQYKYRDFVVSKDDSKIVIYDDGVGMSFDDIKNKWMEIGTTSKENIDDEVNNRVINGEKGIGRFGTDKLGAELKLISVGNDGKERVTLLIDWNAFDDHTKKIEDFSFKCLKEELTAPESTGVRLEISKLRDFWTYGDLLKLRRHLKKLVSPYAQETQQFNIYIDYGNNVEKVVNDSFEYANTWIEASLNKIGQLTYEIATPKVSKREMKTLPVPQFGPVKLKVYYLDKAAKQSFSLRNGIKTADYGNIKVFRDNFRVLPYGEKENDWLGIDNEHAQGIFRTFGTRDLIGYVQISKRDNPILKDATSRQGLNEDTIEFEQFKVFIWSCITLLQDAVFKEIKEDSEKQGKIIETRVKTIQSNVSEILNDMPQLFDDTSISKVDESIITDRLNKKLIQVNKDVKTVEKANQHLSERIRVMEKIVGSENRIYDMLHAVKNKLEALNAIVSDIEDKSQEYHFAYDSEFAKKSLTDIKRMVLTAMRRSSPTRGKRTTIYLDKFVEEFVSDNRKIYSNIEFNSSADSKYRIRVNLDSLRITFENLLDNAIKAMEKTEDKRISIRLSSDTKFIYVFFDDNGKGVSKDDAPFIFNVSFSKTNGTGFGLANVLENMKEENGDISLMESGSLLGASFRLQFPKN